MEKEKEVEILNISIITSILFIVAISISIFLTVERKKNVLNQKTVFTKKGDQYINLFNRLLVFVIVIVIFYDDYQSYKLGKSKGEDPKPLSQQMFASSLAIVSAIISLYVVYETWETDNTADLENPIF